MITRATRLATRALALAALLAAAGCAGMTMADVLGGVGGMGGWGDEVRGEVEWVDGRVLDVDHRRGWFEMESRDGRWRVTLPHDAPSTLARRFRTLRRGQTVRIEGARIDRGRVELYRFR